MTIGRVLSLEGRNAALECLADTLHPDLAHGIADAKHAAAGAVLIVGAARVRVGSVSVYSVLS